MTPLTTESPKAADSGPTMQVQSTTIPLPIPVRRVQLLQVPFHCLKMDEALACFENFIVRKCPHQVVLGNAYTAALCQKDGELQSVVQQADLVLADGMSIVWGARWIGVHIPKRLAGPDVMAQLCGLAERKGYGIFLMGSSRENLEQLKNELWSLWPALRIVGMHSPPMCDSLEMDETENIVRQLHETQPDILFVGMSAPKQEKWIAQNLARLTAPLCIGVGAAFDFLSGRVPRAPDLMQNVGLEWLYRLYREPRRLWKRYLLGNAIFLSFLVKELIHQKIHPKQIAPPA